MLGKRRILHHVKAREIEEIDDLSFFTLHHKIYRRLHRHQSANILHGESDLVICSSKEAPAKVATYHNASAHSKIHQAPFQPNKSHVKWTTGEDVMLLQMSNDDCSWEDISATHPGALSAVRRSLKGNTARRVK